MQESPLISQTWAKSNTSQICAVQFTPSLNKKYSARHLGIVQYHAVCTLQCDTVQDSTVQYCVVQYAKALHYKYSERHVCKKKTVKLILYVAFYTLHYKKYRT